MKIIVSGGAGFIGSNLVEHFLEDDRLSLARVFDDLPNGSCENIEEFENHPIDPLYLTWKAREFEKHTRFIELAGEVNTNMPTYVVERTMHALNTHKKPMNGSKILVIGLAYKPDVDDMRESPTFKIFDLLKAKGAEIDYYDPFMPEIWEIREHAEYAGKKTIEWDKETASGYDAVVISTNYSTIDYADWRSGVNVWWIQGMRCGELRLKAITIFLRHRQSTL